MATPEVVSIAEANKAVDTIVKVLHSGNDSRSIRTDDNAVLVISEVVKGGSLGHGTSVRDNYDLDLVIYSKSLSGEDVLKKGLEFWLTCVQQFLEDKLPGKITKRNRTFTSLQFKFDGYIDVDLLLSPFWREPNQYYTFLQSIDFKERMKFSVGASRWQVAFFKKQPNVVKELIQRAKAWRNKEWSQDCYGSSSPTMNPEHALITDPYGKPKSYLLSVLVLRAFETASRHLGNGSFHAIALETSRVMQYIVKGHHRVDIYWEEYYKKETYPDLFPPNAPRIVDPANPFNNLYKSGIAAPSNRKAQDHRDGGGKWDRIASIIDTLDLTKSIE